MSCILDISTAVPEFRVENEELVRFYAKASASGGTGEFIQKLMLLSGKMKINTRYSCIPDYNGIDDELYTNGNYVQPVERRMEVYRKKVVPLAAKAIDKVLSQSSVEPDDITHLVTVSCTGLMAPGLELLLAEAYGLQHAEKSSLNFLGCYAGLKALKHAHYIAQAKPDACILIVSVELCSLHFYPSESTEDIISNLLFADGAASAIVCGNKNKYVKNKVVLQIDTIGSAFIPNTADLMTWEISSSAFRMHLSSAVVTEIKRNIQSVVYDFLGSTKPDIDYWAIHPGGVKIVEVVKERLGLDEGNVSDSMNVLQQFGNMSSPTILFILNNIFNKIKELESGENKKIFSCAFGPGLNIEMLSFSSVNMGFKNKNTRSNPRHAVEA